MNSGPTLPSEFWYELTEEPSEVFESQAGSENFEMSVDSDHLYGVPTGVVTQNSMAQFSALAAIGKNIATAISNALLGDPEAPEALEFLDAYPNVRQLLSYPETLDKFLAYSGEGKDLLDLLGDENPETDQEGAIGIDAGAEFTLSNGGDLFWFKSVEMATLFSPASDGTATATIRGMRDGRVIYEGTVELPDPDAMDEPVVFDANSVAGTDILGPIDTLEISTDGLTDFEGLSAPELVLDGFTFLY
ncbi:hypothetical protein [Paracoccus sp. SCSIO 75233]|uniref:hypothetical protein n=1 Tax=Paracoccus sp. SCSIO 75233 TaxID=3017782 RepID=UPI0022F0CAFE|nr:hypothetical protein [Paracoccus sp. SCSIO 75233]WBU53855.1 hypothetical protein PAF12_03165 [Paracoccus sp. SCSIO 75233]